MGIVVVACWARSSCGATAGDHDIYRKAGEIICYGREPVRLPFRRPIFKYDALAIDIAEVAQPSPEVVPDRRIVNDADAWSLFWPLLSLCYERPCHHTSETRDERAPLDALERHPTPPKGQPAPMRYPSMPTSKNEGASGGSDDRLGSRCESLVSSTTGPVLLRDPTSQRKC